MATHGDIDGDLLLMLGHPDTDYPTREMRHAWALLVVDTLAKEITASGKPTRIDRFTLQISAGETEKTIPRDDFEALFHATDDRGRAIPVINFVDADRWGVDAPPGQSTGAAIATLAVRGSGDRKRLVAYPPGAAATLTVYYLRSVDHGAGVADAVDLLDGFERVLVPAGVGLYGAAMWRWSNLPKDEWPAMRSGFMDANNPMSLKRVFLDQKALFLDRIYSPFVMHASDRLSSPGAQHIRGRNPWG